MVGTIPLQIHFWLCTSLIAFTLCLPSTFVSARTVSFVVMDEQGNPVPDAVILVPGRAPADIDPEPAVMDQVDRQFLPHVLTVARGRSVSFPNSDNIRHHVYSFSSPKVFELKLYAGKPETPIRFDQAGIVVLGCNIHDGMVGYIVVSDGAAWAHTDKQGMATLALAVDVKEVQIWHPQKRGNIAGLIPVPVPDSLPADTLSVKLSLKSSLKSESRPDTGSGFNSNRFRRYGS